MNDDTPSNGLFLNQKDFDRIVKVYIPMYLHAGFSLQDAQDLLSEAILKWHQNQDKVQKSPRAYFDKIARNELLNGFRAQSAKKRMMSTPLTDEQLAVLSGGFELPGQRLLLRDLLDTLPPRQQEIVKLLLSGFNQLEIAEILDIKPSTVNYHVKLLRLNIVLLLGLRIDNTNPQVR